MTISTLSVGAAVTPTVVKTYISHYTQRKPRHQKPTAHISYDEGLHLIRSFLDFASNHTVEELQAFTAQWVPHPRWVKVDNVVIPAEQVARAADVLAEQLGPRGLDKIGGSEWWQWRRKGGELKAEWIEMRAHYHERKRLKEKCKRVMLYVHGGAYFFGSVDEHRYQMQRHARKLKARVLAPRYRLAPQFPFPCGLQDCLAAYLYLLTVQDPMEIILAGDSAGGGMVVSMMCILRDRGLPLPAGAILISPWVDLTHSFPSLGGDGAFDYIPAHGFMQKPSASWPPPNDDEILAIAKGAISKQATEHLSGKSNRQARKSAEFEAVQGFAVVEQTANANLEEAARENPNNPTTVNQPDSEVRPGNTIPGPGHRLSIAIDGNLIKLKDQIQMYTTNQLISHPLVSPVLQPSLGGLPPLLILTGGGELLRDEQIYLAHKAANPSDPRYRLGTTYQAEYDPDGAIAEKWACKPTPVQLQVWDDLCHVAPTLSFTRPAKFMYRSVAQFGAWALARAQGVGVEIVDDDQISIISRGSDTDTESDTEAESTDSLAKDKKATKAGPNGNVSTAQIGTAGSPLPAFKNHMIRQRVDRHGVVFPLAPAAELPALQMDREDVGVIKPGPVQKWMAAKEQWDSKFARQKRAVQKRRIKEMALGRSFGHAENPPPSALAGRKKDRDEPVQKGKKSMGLAMWSLWGSKHDENTMKREEEVEKDDEKSRRATGAERESTGVRVEERVLGRRVSGADKEALVSGAGEEVPDGLEKEQTAAARRRTITVVDHGQVEGVEPQGYTGTSSDAILVAQSSARATSPSTRQPEGTSGTETPTGPGLDSTHLTPLFLPKYKSHLSHLQSDSKDSGDGSSLLTGVESDNASTMAVFAAPGVMVSKDENGEDISTDANDNAKQLGLAEPASTGEYERDAASMRDFGPDGAETPGSRRSVERLVSHQVQGEGPGEHIARMQAMRSSSSTAIMRAEGVVGVVDDSSHNEAGMQRPGLYSRENSEFQTAMEKL